MALEESKQRAIKSLWVLEVWVAVKACVYGKILRISGTIMLGKNV